MGVALRAFGKLPDFRCDNGKPAPFLPGSCCYNRCVQGKQIGLLGDSCNDTDNPADILGMLA
ncbi:hypothetical protein D3C77_738490 [compost metagenome]